MSAQMSSLSAALMLAEEFGIPVFPCRPDKKPYTAHGFKDASTSIEQISEHWQRWPDALLAVPTGSPSKIVVVDVDPNGADWYREHAAQLGCARVHQTRRGHHLLYQMPEVEVRNSANELAQGVDVRGEGGYIVWWPAHGFESAGSLEELTPLPQWLLDRLIKPSQKSAVGSDDALADGQIREPGRNDFLSREAYRLRKNGCNAEQISEVLLALNRTRCVPPLNDDEVRGIATAKVRNVEPDEKDVEPPGQPLPNARRFVKVQFAHDERPLLVYQGGTFFRWDGTCWPMLDDGQLRAELYEYFESKSYQQETRDGFERKPFAPNRYKVADLVDALRAVVHTPINKTTPSWFTSNPLIASDLVACSNGLVHVPTRTLQTHTPQYYTHHSVPFAFHPSLAKPSRWLGFLKELWPNDDESIAVLQEIFGYLVAGDTRQQKMFLLVGPKRSGKGTIARILRSMIGAHNVAGPTLASLGTNFGLSPIIGKPVAIVADARLKAADTSIVTERLLSISGEDTLTVDRKYKEPWTGQLSARVVILSNELPRLTDSSGALASRFIVLSMSQSFYGRENPGLTAELSVELPAIFNWSLDGLERLRERGRFVQPTASQEAIRELEDLGSPIGAFLRDECQLGSQHTVPCDDLFHAWIAWSEANGRKHAGSSQVFGRDLRAVCPGIRLKQPRGGDDRRYRAYLGIGLARDGTRSTPMCYQQPHAEPQAHTQQYIAPVRVPSRANCPSCAGEGCEWCRQ